MIPINPSAIDIFLQPGEVYFGDRSTRLRTILGSCVSITFWHPRHLLGGMCHFMLPSRGHRHGGDLDGRYGDEAVALLVRQMHAQGTKPKEYQVKIFGGGRMFSFDARRADLDVGRRNIDTARNLLAGHGIVPASKHLAGTGHRSLIFEVASGDVWVKHVVGQAGLQHVA